MTRWMTTIILTAAGTNLTLMLMMGGGLFFLPRKIDAVVERFDRRFDDVNKRFDVVNDNLRDLSTRVGVLEGTVRGLDETGGARPMGSASRGRLPEASVGEGSARP